MVRRLQWCGGEQCEWRVGGVDEGVVWCAGVVVVVGGGSGGVVGRVVAVRCEGDIRLCFGASSCDDGMCLNGVVVEG